jgi:hypothetical protein
LTATHNIYTKRWFSFEIPPKRRKRNTTRAEPQCREERRADAALEVDVEAAVGDLVVAVVVVSPYLPRF